MRGWHKSGRQWKKSADLWSVPVPIPDSPLRYTLTYLIAAEGS